MWTTKLCLAAALTALSVAGCTKKNPHKCNTEEPCTLVDAPYCDITGQFGGTPYRCIPDPGVDKLRVDPSSKDFGSVALGQSSSATTFTITNTGTAPTGSLAVSMGGANLSSFAIGANTCAGQTLAANATCTVAVTFQPTAAGAAAGELSVTGTPGGTARAALAGNGLASGALAIAPATQDFGSVVAGQNSATTTFTITNPGAAATGALTVALSGGDSSQFALTSDGCSTQTLSAGGSCNVVVRFNPTTAGTKSSSIMVTASPGGSTSAVLMGTGLMAGALTISPTSRDYGPVPQGGMSAPFAFTVTNTGGATTGSLSSALTGTGSDQFSITTNGCAGMTLASQATCMIAVRFDPTSAGSKNASLTVSGNPGGNAATALTGMGLSPATLSVMPAAQNYGDVAVGNNSTATITVSNSGGVASGTPSVAITGADMALFTIASNTCVGALPPAGSCTASVRFAPTSAGNKAAMLTASATPGGMAVASLNGNGLAPGNLAIAPTARDFGSVLQGQMSSALSFTVSNSGQTATSSLSVGLTGSGAAQFSVMTDTCSGQTLAPSASCMVSVIFRPNAAGAMTASLSVTATTGGTAAATINGTGLAPASLTVSPSSSNYGSVTTSTTSAPTTFTVRNAGDEMSGLPNAALAGANPSDFVLGTNTCSTGLAAGATCTIQVSFRPTTTGARGASLNVTASPGGTPAATLSGMGASPGALSINPTMRDYGPVLQNTTGPSQVFTVTNTGGSTTSTISVDLGGTQANQFSKTADTCAGMTLGAGNTCSITVGFMPTSLGAKSATLTVTAGGGMSAPLTGTGIQCTTNAQCGGTTPVCVTASSLCRACGQDSECSSLVCNETGACQPEADTVYADPAGSVSPGCGTKAQPCQSLVTALQLTGGSRNTIRMALGGYTAPELSISGKAVTIVGAGVGGAIGSWITPMLPSAESTIRVVDSSVTIRDLWVYGGSSNVQNIVCGSTGVPTDLRLLRVTVRGGQGDGFYANPCNITIERSRIGWNGGSGLRLINSPFRVENTFIMSNLRGGFLVAGAGGIFRNNTVSKNQSSASVASGVGCSSSIVPAAVFDNNIVFDNTGGPNWAVTPPSPGAGCEWRYSDIDAVGVGNINQTPLFISTDSANYDFHIMGTSPCRNVGLNSAAPSVDYDGEARPQNGTVDMGADEVP